MEKTLISQKEVLDIAFSLNPQNRPSSINEAKIVIAQERFIKPALRDIYDKLESPQMQAFVQEYVKPPLAFFVKFSVIDEIAIAISDDGLHLNYLEEKLYDTEKNSNKNTASENTKNTNTNQVKQITGNNLKTDDGLQNKESSKNRNANKVQTKEVSESEDGSVSQVSIKSADRTSEQNNTSNKMDVKKITDLKTEEQTVKTTGSGTKSGESSVNVSDKTTSTEERKKSGETTRSSTANSDNLEKKTDTTTKKSDGEISAQQDVNVSGNHTITSSGSFTDNDNKTVSSSSTTGVESYQLSKIGESSEEKKDVETSNTATIKSETSKHNETGSHVVEGSLKKTETGEDSTLASETNTLTGSVNKQGSKTDLADETSTSTQDQKKTGTINLTQDQKNTQEQTELASKNDKLKENGTVTKTTEQERLEKLKGTENQDITEIVSGSETLKKTESLTKNEKQDGNLIQEVTAAGTESNTQIQSDNYSGKIKRKNVASDYQRNLLKKQAYNDAKVLMRRAVEYVNCNQELFGVKGEIRSRNYQNII